MTATFRIEEAVGASADVQTVTAVHLFSADAHSSGDPALLSRNSDGTAVHSCERWLRLRFDQPFGRVFNLRFWSDNLHLAADWDLRYGISFVYHRPSPGASTIALRVLPTADPGEGSANILGGSSLYGFDTAYSPWLVLQVTWSGTDAPDDMQIPALNLSFKWREC